MNRVLLVTLCFVFAVCAPAGAQDMDAMMDGFYIGLANIVERNMNAPDQCVIEVDAYYVQNQDVINKVREISEKHMAASAEMMERAMSMTEEELEALSIEMEGKRFEQDSSMGNNRYTDVMQEFSMKYPQQGMKVTMKAMQFMSGGATQQGGW